MYFLKKQTSDKNVTIGLCYSIFQKCIRRCLTPEALYYGRLIYNDGTPNALRKRLIMSCLEDMANGELALEILTSSDNQLFDYIKILSQNKKTHISSWYQRVCLDYAIYNTKTEDNDIKIGIKMHNLTKDKNFKEIRSFLGKDYNKLYTFMSKERLVWAVKILNESRPELKYKINRNIDQSILPRKFIEIPYWVKDKHVAGGTPGYKFFFDHGCVMDNRIYPEIEPYEEECKNIYFFEENFIKARTKSTYDRWSDNQYYKEYIPSELLENGYRNIIQIQLLTRKGKPKVYFATDFKNNKKYVLKGPLNYQEKKKIEFTEKIKSITKFPRLDSKIINLNGHFWLKSNSLIDYSDDVIEKESKIESKRLIYNGINVNCNFDLFFGPDKNVNYSEIDLIMATLFKVLVGAKDFASRNYLIKDTVYSIDDHSYFPEEPNIFLVPEKVVKKHIKKYWINYLKLSSNKEIILKILKKWKKRIKKYNRKNKLEHFDILKKRIKSIMKML